MLDNGHVDILDTPVPSILLQSWIPEEELQDKNISIDSPSQESSSPTPELNRHMFLYDTLPP
jgi:hypothetical protein